MIHKLPKYQTESCVLFWSESYKQSLRLYQPPSSDSSGRWSRKRDWNLLIPQPCLKLQWEKPSLPASFYHQIPSPSVSTATSCYFLPVKRIKGHFTLWAKILFPLSLKKAHSFSFLLPIQQNLLCFPPALHVLQYLSPSSKHMQTTPYLTPQSCKCTASSSVLFLSQYSHNMLSANIFCASSPLIRSSVLCKSPKGTRDIHFVKSNEQLFPQKTTFFFTNTLFTSLHLSKKNQSWIAAEVVKTAFIQDYCNRGKGISV